MDVNGVAAIVTGGASGLGEATARLLAQNGAKVLIVDLQDDKGQAVAADIGGAYARTDVADTAQVEAAVEQAAALAPLRVLVNCAGIAWAQRTIGREGTYESAHPLDVFEKIIRVNLIGTFNCIRLAATAMGQTEPLDHGERGVIVNTASVAAFDGQIGQAAYSASKGGIVGMTLPVARDLAAIGVRVNSIAPGLIDTPLLAGFPEERREAMAQSVLFPRRLGQPADVASLILEIVRNGYLNGEVIRVDGGIRLPPK